MNAIVGHVAAQAAFERALASNTLHHAWLLVGPAGVGKASFAKQAAAMLVGNEPYHASLIAARSHPDYKLIEREVWDKSSPPRIVPYDQRKEDEGRAAGIRIAQIRALEPILAMSPSVSRRRAIIIDSADELDRNASNALLKSLEEPPASTVFLLVSHAPGRLLPTIRSRCRMLRFEALRDDDMRAVLRAGLSDASAQEIDALVAVGEGSPGVAMRYAGLDVASIDAAIGGIAADGDRDNARRVALARSLSGKSAQARYDAFLDRAPAFIARAAWTRRGTSLRIALDAYHSARDAAGAARGLSLDAQTTVYEMAGILATLRE